MALLPEDEKGEARHLKDTGDAEKLRQITEMSLILRLLKEELG